MQGWVRETPVWWRVVLPGGFWQEIGMSVRALGSLAIVVFLALNAQSRAEPVRPRSCFFTQNFENWKAPDDRTIYIRIGVHSFYRLDLAARCPALLSANPSLITHWRGSNSVCDALDWDLKVARGFPGSAEPCIVRTMTPLTTEEAAAIPRKFKP
jgi:hypothetical protein